MKKATLFLIFLLLFVVPATAAVHPDAKGCKDHPLFNRMSGVWLYNCAQKDFDFFNFPVEKGKTERVEGRKSILTYYPEANLPSKPSELQVLRNYENAVTKLGGKAVFVDKARETLRLDKDGKEYWIEIWAEFTGKYGMTIVEKEAMKQDIVVNAEAISNDLKSTGHIAIYGILFDTNKADIKPESAQAVGEIAKLLQKDPGLKLYVVGHTDATGVLDHNLRLSQERAESVLQALIRTHGIAAARLRSFGAGPFAPVASNDSDGGRAKNRRVELVKQ
jgi:outer membrane protein OmpA-like peptidoglycan-associated protein